MAIAIKSQQTDRPTLSPREAENYTGGAVTYDVLKRDRFNAENNGTKPKIPYYRFGHRTVKYCQSDLDTYLNAMRVE